MAGSAMMVLWIGKGPPLKVGTRPYIQLVCQNIRGIVRSPQCGRIEHGNVRRPNAVVAGSVWSRGSELKGGRQCASILSRSTATAA